ncbi:MAG: hypothetical protein RMM53_13925, partial [Bacteroidia bacterium]|nr:hypothetical protein [Bacteroidia bacterium]
KSVRAPVVVCPNYFVPPVHPPSLSRDWVESLGEFFLYTGTLAESWGADAAVRAARKMNVKLVVAGHTHDPRYFRRLKTEAAGADVVFVGGTTYVDYADVVALIRACRAGFALYRPDPHLLLRTPSKFFEYSALGKPLYFTDAWRHCDVYGVPVPFPPDDFVFPPPPPVINPRLDENFRPFDPVEQLYRTLLN